MALRSEQSIIKLHVIDKYIHGVYRTISVMFYVFVVN